MSQISIILKLTIISCVIQNLITYQISVLHINDFHARFEETNFDSGVCKNPSNCIGGFSRLYSLIQKIYKLNPNQILVNAGDNFEGSLWYDVYKWNVTQHFLKKLPTDAYTLGNHEFEDKIEGLVPFLENLNSPVVVANINASREPTIQNLFNKSIVIERNGRKIGIIGVIASTTGNLNDIGNLTLLNESESVNSEAERLIREENVFTNIILSHCGYNTDIQIAQKSKSKISLIVGGHSHSFLYTGENYPGPDRPTGPYPTVIENSQNQKILVVQASAFNKYLGNITISYDQNGNVVKWEGNPIFLDNSLPKDDEINKELLIWKQEIDKHPNNRIIGKTIVRLEQSSCPTSECLIGNFITDAMVAAYQPEIPEANTWTRASIAVTHAGGIRSGIDIGNVSYNEIISMQPFKNTIDLGEIRGDHLKEIFEFCVASPTLNLLQVSGVHVVYNLSLPVGSRVVSLKLRCQRCVIPTYENYNPNQFYKIVLPDFLANGGFGFRLIKQYLRNRFVGDLDTDLYVRYVESKSPIFQEIQGRIIICQ